MVRTDRTATLYAVGGQYRHPAVRTKRFLDWKGDERHDGLYLLFARNVHELSGTWFPYPPGTFGYSRLRRGVEESSTATAEREARVRRVFSGIHSSCIECRIGAHGACEFDGRISLTRFRGRFLIYARANTNRGSGGRYVQVARSVRDDPAGPYLPFRLLTILGYQEAAMKAKDIYFAAVQPNPIDVDGTLLGLFPVALDRPLPRRAHAFNRPGHADATSAGAHGGLVGLSISCDGLLWAPLVVLIASRVTQNRTWDQPVDGFLTDGTSVFAFIHANVPGIAAPKASPGLVQVSLTDGGLLTNLTRAAHAHMPGCSGRKRDRDAFART